MQSPVSGTLRKFAAFAPRRRRIGTGVLALAALTLLTDCAQREPPREPAVTALPPLRDCPPSFTELGRASWYGRTHNGRPTASGAPFDMNGMTAAHRVLPMGSRVRIDNLENGRSVVLTVNDRGPFVRGRIVDVSREAARQLGFAEQGTAQVRLTAVTHCRIGPRADEETAALTP